jgi:hypothetical protein
LKVITNFKSSYIKENNESSIIIPLAIHTITLTSFIAEVLLFQKIEDRIIPRKENSKEIRDIVYRPFRNSGK